MARLVTILTVETKDGDNFPILVASYIMKQDGYVMVIDDKGYDGRAYFGDLIMGACQAAGFSGMVIDGNTRDCSSQPYGMRNAMIHRRAYDAASLRFLCYSLFVEDSHFE